MIAGEVSATGDIIVPVTVRGSSGLEEVVRAVVDTGFGAFLTLPPSVIRRLSLPDAGFVNVSLGDGSRVALPKYEATIVWDGQERVIPVYEADADPLIGMKLLYGFDFHVHVVDGGMVALNRLP